MLDKTANQTTDDLKRQAVLDGAKELFLAHGFRRVTMEDIASAANMSRPALYLVFRNKTDIYRALAKHLFETCYAAIDAELNRDIPLTGRLGGAIESVIYGVLAEIENKPHGTELIDLKTSLAADLISEWMGRIAERYAVAIEEDAKARGIDLEARGFTAVGLANTMICAIDGAKHRFNSLDAQRGVIVDSVRLIELAMA